MADKQEDIGNEFPQITFVFANHRVPGSTFPMLDHRFPFPVNVVGHLNCLYLSGEPDKDLIAELEGRGHPVIYINSFNSPRSYQGMPTLPLNYLNLLVDSVEKFERPIVFESPHRNILASLFRRINSSVSALEERLYRR